MAYFRTQIEAHEMDDRAVVLEVGGQVVLDDPEALELIRGINKQKCKVTLDLHIGRVEHFKSRLVELGMTADQAVIAVLNVNDVRGGSIAEAIMSGHNWQEIRDRGEVPFMLGIIRRDFIQEGLGIFDQDAAQKLNGLSGVAVVVVDHGVAEVFSV